ncbi:TIGR03943 family protein [Microbacterium sp. CIAB417]|uniref:TIGR03943 family putative permease subunit n=1 Tax=Microbacterium sp. CIAB417 TaxID=2860287 RepID=UPI001FAD97FE|nr:TIGR03943 family protein [Microbacterium sp. CIAB417]
MRSVLTRWLGAGLAAAVAVITLVLAVTGRIGLYINPDGAWFAIGMAVVVLVGTALSFVLPLGAEDDHGHDHGEVPHDDHAHHAHERRVSPGAVAAVAGGVLASGVVVTMLALPPASLSAELAASRDVGAPPLFAGSDVVSLASTGDTSKFGVGDWAAVFATATNPDAFEGDSVTLTGFVSGDIDGGFDLSRLVITHCVIDAQPARLSISADAAAPSTGQWVTVSGTVRATGSGQLAIVAEQVTPIGEPSDPYEY